MDLASLHREVQIGDVSDWVFCELPKLRYIISYRFILFCFNISVKLLLLVSSLMYSSVSNTFVYLSYSISRHWIFRATISLIILLCIWLVCIVSICLPTLILIRCWIWVISGYWIVAHRFHFYSFNKRSSYVVFVSIAADSRW